MRTIEQWFADDGGMPPAIAKLARANMTKPKAKAKTLSKAIISGMGRWDHTPQGFDFWNACHDAAFNSDKWPAIPGAARAEWFRYGDKPPTEKDADCRDSVCCWEPVTNTLTGRLWFSECWSPNDLWTAAPRKEGGV